MVLYFFSSYTWRILLQRIFVVRFFHKENTSKIYNWGEKCVLSRIDNVTCFIFEANGLHADCRVSKLLALSPSLFSFFLTILDAAYRRASSRLDPGHNNHTHIYIERSLVIARRSTSLRNKRVLFCRYLWSAFLSLISLVIRSNQFILFCTYYFTFFIKYIKLLFIIAISNVTVIKPREEILN